MANFNWAKKLYADKFSRYLILSLVIIAAILFFREFNGDKTAENDGLAVDFFFHPQCPHCKEQKPFNDNLMEKYPDVTWVYHDITKPDEAALFGQFAAEYNIPRTSLGVPGTFFGSYHFIGFDRAETSGKQIEAALQDYIAGKKGKLLKDEESASRLVTIPFLGQIDTLDYSLPALAVILGLVDGFNPCAMWVLVYLISLIMGLNSKRKMWLIAGTFVFASGVLYFLFMTAWLNVFLLVGYMRWLTIIIGLVALYFGIASIRDYIKTKGALVCKSDDFESRQKTMGRIEWIVKSPLTLATIIWIIGLAFVVNSIEFACSSALPAIFTYTLSISGVSTMQYYLYILLYDIFFMLDDAIIFGLAVFAANTTLGSRYAKYCKLIGGIVLAALGLALAFAPHLLG